MRKTLTLEPWPVTHASRQGQSSYQARDNLHRGLGKQRDQPSWLCCCRGTDSHSIYNWAENMRYWSTDFDVPFPGSDGAKVHTGMCIIFTSLQSSL